MAPRGFARGVSKRFSRIDWGAISESFKASCRIGFGDALNDIREESTQSASKFDRDSDDQDEEITRRSPLCLILAVLATVTAAAVVGYLGFHPDSAISFNWKAMSSNMLGSLSGTVKQQQTDEQALLKIAENVTAVCGHLSSPYLRTTARAPTSTGLEMCRELCRHHLCCVLEDYNDQYSCAGDPSKHCSVYAGCEALVYYFLDYRQSQSEVWD